MFFEGRILTEDQVKMIKNSDAYKACIAYDQKNPHHFLTLDLHMEKVEREVEKQRPHDGWLITAAMLHDVGKPEVAFFDRKGNRRFFGHAARSAEIARKLLLAAGYPETATDIVCWYIQHHDDFISFKVNEEEVQPDHPFIRLITAQNVAEAILKTFMDFDSEKDIDRNATVRFLVTGKAPSWGKVVTFRFKEEDDIPPLFAFESLLVLCRADASAQVGSEAKIAVFDKIEDVLHAAYTLAAAVMGKNK